MLKYFFNGIVGFATIVGTAYIFLVGIPFYIVYILSLLLTLVTIFAWYQSDRVSRLKAVAFPLLAGLLQNVGAEAVPIVVKIADYPGMQKEVTEFLSEVLHKKPDPTEQHWIYVALGKIGGKKSKLLIKKGLSNENEFARLGAEIAWKLINEKRGK